MAISNYSELKTAIGEWMHRDDLTGQYDSFIDLTEDFLKREPQRPDGTNIGGIRADIQRLAGTMTSGTATVALPSDFLEMYRLELTGSTYTVMRYVGPTQLQYEYKTGSGRPIYFTISDVIELDIKPDSAYAYQLSYWPKVTALSDSNTTNWVITNYPDVYLAGCLYWANRFTQNQQEAQNWLSQYKSASWTASETYRQGRFSQGSIEIRTDL